MTIRIAKSKGKYLFPTYALTDVFKATFMSTLREKGVEVPQSIARQLFCRRWVVYAKQPFLEACKVVEYLGRYTHKIAISNHRITNTSACSQARFKWKDYRDGNRKKGMSLHAQEFLRRFSQHILPSRFVRIRHYGMLCSRNKTTLLNLARQCFGIQHWQRPTKEDAQTQVFDRLGITSGQCPYCKQGTLEVVQIIEPKRRSPTAVITPNYRFHAA